MADVTVVDEHDRVVGKAEYLDARRTGLYHRITQVVIQNKRGEVLLQLRGPVVHEAPGTWDLGAGGHVDPGYDYLDAALNEAREEVGLADLSLTELGKHLSEIRGPTEVVRRFNTVYSARFDGEVLPDQEEAAAVRWIGIPELGAWIDRAPDEIAPELHTVYRLYLLPMICLQS
ncbi:MAG TPA: NUDIX domain-containing protein [Candidatus Saccharimonadia bacterium]|nr:NUDIX domain-containing protein [Candidatus Saccharimonadia bacterium]